MAENAVATANVLSRKQPAAQQAKPMRIKHCYILLSPGDLIRKKHKLFGLYSAGIPLSGEKKTPVHTRLASACCVTARLGVDYSDNRLLGEKSVSGILFLKKVKQSSMWLLRN